MGTCVRQGAGKYAGVDRPTDQQVRQWYPRLYRAALRMTGSLEDAADLTQETLCRALRKWDGFDGRVLVTTWLHRILINCTRDWLRRKAIRANLHADELILRMVPGASPAATDCLERRERRTALREAIEALSRTLRAAFVLAVIDGYTYEQVADLLRVPVGTIASRVHQARRHLCAVMRRAFPEA
jgi:RNA polymerase sigma-70 factor (ECF subfamily)